MIERDGAVGNFRFRATWKKENDAAGTFRRQRGRQISHLLSSAKLVGKNLYVHMYMESMTYGFSDIYSALKNNVRMFMMPRSLSHSRRRNC